MVVLYCALLLFWYDVDTVFKEINVSSVKIQGGPKVIIGSTFRHDD